MMTPRLRKFALTMHVVLSVGFLGSVAAFLALVIAGLSSEDMTVLRAVYPAGALITFHVIVPLSVASLLSGTIQALGTPWGLFRHYWVLVKFLLTAFTLVVLLVQTPGIRLLAEAAADAVPAGLGLEGLRASLVLHAGGGLFVLVVTTVLSVYKPRGMTRYGWIKEIAQKQRTPPG